MKKILTTLLLLIAFAANGQTVNVTGVVTDAARNEPMISVTVAEKGTNNGVATDMDGKFSINVTDPNATLVFTFIGYQREFVPLAGRTNLTVKLTSTSKTDLDELVVVGYGTQKKRDITGAVAQMKADNLDERAIQRVDQALIGQMAGVQVKQTTGAPGKALSISVRGTGSVGAGNEPLYVVDGFPLAQSSPGGTGSYSTGNPLDNINQNDIESIQVLKDAAAAAIYGSRAANGVVLITTKRGKTGKNQISVNVTTGLSSASKKVAMMDGDQWIDRATEMINAQWVASGAGRTADQTNAKRAEILGLAAGAVNTTYMTDPRWAVAGHPGLSYHNWENEIFRSAPMQNYTLSASGGTDIVHYFISGNYQNTQGIVQGLDYRNFATRANVEINANKRLKIGLNIAPSYSVRNDPGVEGKDNILHQALSFTPIQEDTMGSAPNTYNNGQYVYSNSLNSPVTKLSTYKGRSTTMRTIASTYANLNLMKGLDFKTTLNVDNADNTTENYIPYTVAGSLASRMAQPNVNTSGSYSTYRKQTFVNENTLSYTTTIKNKHNISAVIGQSYNIYRTNVSNITSSGGYTNATIESTNAALGVTSPSATSNATGNSSTQSTLVSYFGRVQYNYDEKYLFSASLRSDGSSRFGEQRKYGYFPSASVGWRVSEEKFMASLKPVISELKARASYGQSGNNNIGDYSYLQTLATANYTFGGSQASGYAAANAKNPNLGWEKSVTYDAGLDLGLFKNRIVAGFDYYIKKSSDLLLYVPLPQVTGFTSYLANTGAMENKGWEVELTTRNIANNKLQWNTNFNLSHFTNKVTSLATGQSMLQISSSFSSSPFTVLQVGAPAFSTYVVKQIGILSAADIASGAAIVSGEKAGDPKYQDYNKDGKIDANDRQILGNPNPKFIFGITNTFRYKGFDLTILIQGQTGGTIYSLLGRAINRTGQGSTDNTLAAADDRWRSATSTGDGTYSAAYSSFGYILNSNWLYSSDYISIRNITLGYDLKKIVKTNLASGARAYISLENFFSWNKYYGGFNPEATNTNLSNNSNYPVAGDYGGLPLAKSVVLGVNLTF